MMGKAKSKATDAVDVDRYDAANAACSGIPVSFVRSRCRNMVDEWELKEREEYYKYIIATVADLEPYDIGNPDTVASWEMNERKGTVVVIDRQPRPDNSYYIRLWVSVDAEGDDGDFEFFEIEMLYHVDDNGEVYVPMWDRMGRS